ncbi:MAG: flippase-like domain-containing protein [Thermoplasmata archaeon]|nr:MAG: flippase-like domain-containing protein [Thermoplasmata archaeon]
MRKIRDSYSDFMEKKRVRNLVINVVMFSIGIIVIGIMLYVIGAENVRDVLLKADLTLVLLALIPMFCIIASKLIRWWLLFRETSFLNASRVYLIGQAMNLFAPIGTGEVTRAAIAKAKLGIKARDTMAAVVIERISDMTFLVAMAGVCIILFVPGYENMFFMFILIFVLAIAYFLLFRPEFFDRIAVFIERLFEKRGKFLTRLSLKISVSISKFKGAIIKYHERKAVLGINIVLTISGWLLEAVLTYTLLLAFGVTDPPFILFILVINAMSWIARTFLFLPVGPKEVTFTFLMESLFDIPTDVGSAVAIVILAINWVVLGSGAFISIITFKSKPVAKEKLEKTEEGKEEGTEEDEEAK